MAQGARTPSEVTSLTVGVVVPREPVNRLGEPYLKAPANYATLML